MDFFIANQIFEHTKELFWINHQIFRSLKVGGILYFGVPNLHSLHNRILVPLGFHPTGSKIISAHVRTFSKRDTVKFYEEIGASFLKIERVYGSQFYPFPKFIARPLANLFPTLAFTIFFVVQKIGQYRNEFIEWLKEAKLETNFRKSYDGG